MPLAGGGRIAVPRHPDAVDDDCREARIVVTRHAVPSGCAATIVDLRAIAWTGAVRIHGGESGIGVEAARTEGADRPWFRPRPAGTAPALVRLPAAAVLQAPAPEPPAEPPDDDPEPAQ
jgi:competence protein ComEC